MVLVLSDEVAAVETEAVAMPPEYSYFRQSVSKSATVPKCGVWAEQRTSGACAVLGCSTRYEVRFAYQALLMVCEHIQYPI